MPHFSPMSTLEFGCGVGRLAIPFARRPGAVLAVDRSPAMLAAARHKAENAGVSHIEFRAPRELFASPRKFDLVSCFHVLQRLGPAEGLTLLRELTGRIATGGVGIFHYPIGSSASSLVQASRWAREHMPMLNVSRTSERQTLPRSAYPESPLRSRRDLQVLDVAGVLPRTSSSSISRNCRARSSSRRSRCRRRPAWTSVAGRCRDDAAR